jgi:hypothetical protein
VTAGRVAGAGDPKDWLGENAALVALGLASVAAAIVLLSFAAGLAPFQDTWEFLMNRRGFGLDALMGPHNEHIVVLPVAIYQVLLRLFGMGSSTPEYVVLTAFLLVTALLVFVYVRRRLGPWPALMAAVVLLFLGPAWQDLLWPFEIGFVGSILFGVAMLLALERDDRKGDLTACAFLALSVGFSSLGVAFALGAAVDVLQRRRERGLRRTYVAAVPLLLYAAWYAGWGHDAEGHLTAHNVLVSPLFVIKSIAASIDSLLALSTIAGEAIGRSKWGYVVLAALAVLLAYGWRRRHAFSPRVWPAAAAAAAFWFLAAFSYIPGREAYSSRYLYAGAIFVVLIAADLLQGVRIGRRALLAGAAVSAAVVAFNLVPLREGRDFLRRETVLTRSDLAAIEIARRTIEPSFALTPEIAGTSFLNEIEAGEYLTAVDEYGSPAYTPAELQSAPEAGRVQADVVLANALPVTTEFGVEADRGEPGGGPCRAIRGGGTMQALALRPGLTRIELALGPLGTIRLRRFASGEYPLEAEGVRGGSTTLLRIPGDDSSRPWRLQIEATQGARVCR